VTEPSDLHINLAMILRKKWKTTTKEDAEADCGHDVKGVTFTELGSFVTDKVFVLEMQQEILHALM
jgi:hypothetical protein